MNWLWPTIEDVDDAKKAAHAGAGVAFFVAIVTSIVVYLQTSGRVKLFEHIGSEAYFDAVLFLGIGIGILMMSRIAALSGLILYVAEQVFMMKMGGKFGIAMVFFTLAFVSSVRGTFAYHDMKKESEQSGSEQNIQDETREAPRKKNLFKMVIAGFLGLILIAGVVLVLAPRFLKRDVALLKFPKPNLKPNQSSSVQSVPESSVIPMKGMKTFRMRTGEVIQGKVIFEDEIYYTVETTSGKQEIVIKQDLARSDE